MLQAGRQRFDLQSGGDGRRCAVLPAHDLGEMHWREEMLVLPGKLRVLAHLFVGIAALIVAASRQRQQGKSGQERGSHAITAMLRR
jgi:hypothetical protein